MTARRIYALSSLALVVAYVAGAIAARHDQCNLAAAVEIAKDTRTVDVKLAPSMTLHAWARQNDVSIPIAAMGAAAEETRFAWGVKALPWLILADENRIARAEGFGLHEIDSRLASLAETQK